MLQGLLEHQRGNTSRSSWLVSNPIFAQPGVPWGNIRHFSKLLAGREGNVSHCECRSMLARQPRVCLGLLSSGRSGFWVGSESVTTCMTASWGHNIWGFPTVPWTQKKQPWILLSCCYMEVGLLIKLEPDLRGDRKETSTLVLANIWELPVVEAIELSLIVPFLEVS